MARGLGERMAAVGGKRETPGSCKLIGLATLPARLAHCLRGVFRRGQAERELEQEIDCHLDMLVKQKVSEGMSQEEARRAAYLAFGDVDDVIEQVQNVWLSTIVQSIVEGFRHRLGAVDRVNRNSAIRTVLRYAVGRRGTDRLSEKDAGRSRCQWVPPVDAAIMQELLMEWFLLDVR